MKTYQKVMVVLMIGAIMAGISFVGQAYRLIEICLG